MAAFSCFVMLILIVCLLALFTITAFAFLYKRLHCWVLGTVRFTCVAHVFCLIIYDNAMKALSSWCMQTWSINYADDHCIIITLVCSCVEVWLARSTFDVLAGISRDFMVTPLTPAVWRVGYWWDWSITYRITIRLAYLNSTTYWTHDPLIYSKTLINVKAEHLKTAMLWLF